MKRRIITINTDASFCPEFQVWTYAYWIKSNDFFLRWSWVFKSDLKGSTDAEILAIQWALYLIKIKEYNFWHIIINRDNTNANHTKLKTSITNLKNRTKKKHWRGRRKVEFRRVKAHTNTETKRNYVNDWCDKKAKEELYNYKNTFK